MFENLDPVSAAAHLGDWGFVSHSDLPDGPGGSWLLLGIRPHPALTHFDPERVHYWTSVDGRGQGHLIDLDAQLPLETPFSWGAIRATDRLGIANEWVAFGGELSAAVVDGTVICVFHSDAPILRRGGHSQGWDHGAANLAAFFGRIKVAVDYVPGFEAQVAAASPRVRFAAFVGDLAASYRAAPALERAHPELWNLLRGEEDRLRTREPELFAAGLALAGGAGLRDLRRQDHIGA